MAPRRHGNICCVAAATEDHNRTRETDGTHTHTHERPPEEELHGHKHMHFIDLPKKGGLAKDISGTRQRTVQECVTAHTNTLDPIWIGPATLDHPFT